jgi:putative glutamine transport system substrate-binding protein
MKLSRFFLFLTLTTSLFAAGRDEKGRNRRYEWNMQTIQTPETIRKAGVLHVGVHSDMPNMGQLDGGGKYTGYEIEVARLLARDLLDDENKIEFIPVTNDNREAYLNQNIIDALIATFGKTETRAENFRISSPYYIDFVGLMVRKDSGFTGLGGLNERSIGVIKGTSTRQSVIAAAAAIGVRPHFYEFVRFSEIKAALDAGLLDAFASDRTVLARYYDESVIILPDSFAPREYGITVKLSHTDFAAFVEQRVQQWQRENLLVSLAARFGL